MNRLRLNSALRGMVVLSALAGAGVAIAAAQDAAPAAPALNFSASAIDAPQTFSSSSDEQNEIAAADRPLALEALSAEQPGHRYGRPRYRGGNTNADGSSKFAFMAGAGFTNPVGDNSNYLKLGYAFQVGAGRNFNKKFGVMFQFDYDNFAYAKGVLDGQSSLYFADTDADTGLDGNSHIWSFTLNPTYTFYQGDSLGAYAVVGGGFYHKTATFFIPEEECGYDEFGYEECYTGNATIQNYTSNSPGANGGIGLTYKFSRFSNEKLYAEARVVHTFNTYKPGITYNSSPEAIANYNGNNGFPQNSQSTTYIPVKFGIRF
jgi:hypothetical protein